MDMSFLTGDTEISVNAQRGMLIAGHFMVACAEQASPTDDTPGKLTGTEKLELLGKVAMEVVGSLGK